MQEQITFAVKKATEISQFTENGKRIMHLHYFEFTNEGWLFRWVDNDTDPQWLKTKIEEGVIYLFYN